MADLLVNRCALSDLVTSVYSAVWQLDGIHGGSVGVPDALPLANAGGVFGANVTLAPHRITVSLDLRPATIIDRETMADALRIAMAGLLELTTDAAPERVMYGVLAERPTITPAGNIAAIPVFDLTCVFVLANPTRFALDPTPLALSTTRVACPVGTLPSLCRVWLYGDSTPVVNPSVIVRSHTGDVVSTLALTASLGTGTALDIGRTPERIESYASGVLQTGASAGLTLYTSGAFPVLSPDDANPTASAWPTMELAADSGTPTGLLLYRKAS